MAAKLLGTLSEFSGGKAIDPGTLSVKFANSIDTSEDPGSSFSAQDVNEALYSLGPLAAALEKMTLEIGIQIRKIEFQKVGEADAV